ncbi:MAG: carboxypeptidase-like regulatory domain-containing protein [Bacteroidetes bacterium]|nr:carboxypeptidase-like regulatory domain-containing protein [Bacteroidota bacterium]
MKSLYKTLMLLMFISMLATVAHAQQLRGAEYLFKGRLIDADSGTTVNLSHIRNINKGTITVSNPEGAFTIPVHHGDTLLISRIGYVTNHYAVPAKDPQQVTAIFMQPKTEQLQEVVISKFPSEARFKEQMLALELPEDDVALQLPPPPPASNPNGNGGVTLISKSGLITGFANRFNDKERGRQFKLRMDAKKQREAYIATKFNREIAQQITGLKDEEKLNEFMKFCVLSEDFLISSNEYQIHEAVLGCFKDFIASR